MAGDADQVAAHGAGYRIVVKDVNGRHDVKLALITTEIAERSRGAERFCARSGVRTGRHRRETRTALARRPGRIPSAGDFWFDDLCIRHARRRQSRPRQFAETGTLPWLTRKHGRSSRHHHSRQAAAGRRVSAKNRGPRARCDRAAFPRRDRTVRRRLVGRADECRADHPSTADRDERQSDRAFRRWDIHKEGTQAAIRRVTDALDAERITVREALGYRARIFRWHIILRRKARSGCSRPPARTTA